MEEIMKALQNIQKELNDQKIEIQKNGERVTEQVTQNITNKLEEKFAIWEEKHQTLKEKVENQERRIQFMEKQARARNIIFFGIEEGESSYKNLENNIIKFINEYLSVKLEYRDIQEVKRLGKIGDKPRPILVTFTTLGLKINILKQKNLLKDTQYYLKEDYPKYILEKRKELQKEANKEREKGNRVTIKYDKLVVVKSNNKRALPTSPEPQNYQPQQTRISQTTKKNKTKNPNSPIRRSNSVSEGFVRPGLLNYLVNKNDKNTSQHQNNENVNKNNQI
ncbi:uncharacterized protein LOC123694598 [Colias croceus]|uniref:uncharacterized protein LOC123694598 n=1 Tax=Colias crocea TaxID=72248 RepID=UPI001E27C9BA|nr:uncharacterized protein LOC123694598 [Colias croceus]